MLRILLVLLVCIAFGIALAGGASTWPVRPGFVGLGAMLLSAWMVRRYWQGLRPEGQPGSPERVLWHGLATFGLLLGHLSALVWMLGPVLEMHSLRGHTLAIDNWTLVLGAIISYWIARDPEPRSDERDGLIRAHGLRVGHRALLVMLIGASLALGFAGHTVVGRFNQPMLAQLLIMLIIAQCLVQEVAQLRLYRNAARAELGSDD